jgi:hypothetical protein
MSFGGRGKYSKQEGDVKGGKMGKKKPERLNIK